MVLPHADLALQEWRRLIPEARLESLQEFEDAKAQAEGRASCKLGPIVGEDINVDGSPVLRGAQYKDERGVERIDISATLLRAETPYQAVETYLHEARHAYQKAAVANPGLHADPNQVEAWANNQAETHGYIQPTAESYLKYRGQPVELDANDTARRQADEIYQGHFSDQHGYEAHRSRKELEATQFAENAQIRFGPDYAERIAQETRQRTEQFLQEQKLIEEKQEQDVKQARGRGYGM